MKRILCLVLVFACVIFTVSCGKKKKNEIPGYEEQVSKEIKAEEGGTVESSDGKTSVEIPAGALDGDTTITMTIYDAEGYSDERGKVISKVVDFEPDGTIFKKPVLIKMAVEEAFEDKVVAAAVLHEDTGEWSYSENSEYAALGRDAAGDPIMTSAAGDPIMLNAAGDPIMQNAAGDPIMMASAGDPIMTSAAGDPIMNAAAGDPIMMTTGHFTAYTFIVLDPKEPENDDEPIAETDDDEPVDDSDTTEPDDSDTASPDEDEPVDDDIIPEPDPVYSKVLCTGTTRCVDGYGSFIDCPKEGEELYGQEAQYATKKSCVPAKYTKIAKNPADDSDHTQVIDEVTGLTWIVDITESEFYWSEAKSFCSDLSAGGYEDWRLPTPKEIMSIATNDTYAYAFREFYFPSLNYNAGYLWARQEMPGEEGEEAEGIWTFNISDSELWHLSDTDDRYYYLKCVRGEEYGKVDASNYTSETVNGEEMIHDSSTDLFWQKNAVSEMTEWKDALAYCENLEYAGYTDWRLPNRNELLTLVDYSKAVIKEPIPAEDPDAEEIIASSFPGMTADVFITSTPIPYYGGINGILGINMGSGEFSTWSDSFSVRCVRSDTAGYPEGMNMPYCDETGVAPCKDSVSGYVWSSVFNGLEGEYYDSSVGGFHTDRIALAKGCRAASFAGSKKWRIPTIDEVRTLATNCGELKAGGECNISESCNDFSEDCYDEQVCIVWEGCESDLHDYGHFLSSTIGGGPEEAPWTLNFKEGKFDATVEFTDGIFRCILDETIPEVGFPYTDTETGYKWSEISPEDMNWEEMSAYCGNLGEGWRLPVVDELKTLVLNCPEGDCDQTLSGKYSKFGDIETLWSNDMYMTEHFRVLDFTTASVLEGVNRAKVRCVAEGE